MSGSTSLSPLSVQLLMVVSIVLERNPELEFSDKVDLDGLVKEAFSDFQRDRSRLEGAEKEVAWLRRAAGGEDSTHMCPLPLLG